MNDDEYGAVLRLVRQRTIASGRSDLDGRLMQSRLAEPLGPRAGVLQYLYGLRDDLALGSESTVRETMERFRQFPTTGGGVVEGIVVDIVESDQAALGEAQVDLVGSPQRDEVLADLNSLIAEILEDEVES